MVYYLFENIRGHLCPSQFQALPNENLQMCGERISSALISMKKCESGKSLNLICIMLMS